MLKIKNNFDLKGSIYSGQCFRMQTIGDYYYIIIKDRVLKIKEDNAYYLIESNKNDNLKEIVENYFDLKRDYEEINSKIILADTSMKEIIEVSKRHKILKQDKFEMFISYIISQNNNVKRISSSINKLSELFGEEVMFENQKYYLFPTEERMIKLNEKDLKPCNFGFRDSYILNALSEIRKNNNYLEDIDRMNSKDALEKLLEIKGIGPKVASCILMFGYNRFDVFPIDTWAKKFLQAKYNITNINELQLKLSNLYGEYVGLAIQYMFNYERNIKSQFNS